MKGASEHQVLEQMGKSRVRRVFIAGSHVVQQVEGDHLCGVVLIVYNPQPVSQCITVYLNHAEIGLYSLNLVDNFHTFCHLSEYGIRSVQMRRTSYGSIGCNLFTAELQGRFLGYDATCLGFQTVLQFQQAVVHVLAGQFVEHCFQAGLIQLVFHADHLCFREFASGHNVELTA